MALWFLSTVSQCVESTTLPIAICCQIRGVAPKPSRILASPWQSTPENVPRCPEIGPGSDSDGLACVDGARLSVEETEPVDL